MLDHTSTGHPSTPPRVTRFSPRDQVEADLIRRLHGANVLVTGGTGSFGKTFIRRILEVAGPSRVVVFSRDELKQFEMQNAPDFSGRSELRYFIGDVRDLARLEMAMRDVDVVVHTAALKQVPTAEYNPFECIHTNVLGAENVVQAAIRNSVKRVIALSTDKAANPINLYGASKLAADKIFVAANHLSGSSETRFSVVRYGNVIGSRGSIVPLFKRLIAEKAASLPITDERMTRFWITLLEGVDFVLATLQRMHGGEIFVPKIPSMRIVDLAKALAPDTPYHVCGIRPGEKLHEVMVTEDDARNTLDLADCYVIKPSFKWWNGASHAEDGARPVADGFRYASDTNTEWLDADGLNRILAAA